MNKELDKINIGLSSWIIHDGNYLDFEVGRTYRFALEFHPYNLQSSKSQTKFARNIKANLYNINAQVVYRTDGIWVIDAGFFSFQEAQPPPFAYTGDWVEGEVYLGLDPFFYYEYLCRLPEMPDLSYKFLLHKILLETTPWKIEEDILGGKTIKRDKEKESYKPVQRTDAWNDDNGRAHYILECTKTFNA